MASGVQEVLFTLATPFDRLKVIRCGKFGVRLKDPLAHGRCILLLPSHLGLLCVPAVFSGAGKQKQIALISHLPGDNACSRWSIWIDLLAQVGSRN